MRALRALLVAGAATLAFPAASLADAGTVTGTVGTELSISAPNVTIPALKHGANSTAGAVTVTSTNDWWLTAVDASATGSKGHLVRSAAGVGTDVLSNPLAITLGAAPSGDASAINGDLSVAVTESGTMSDTVPVLFSQAVGNAEDIKEGEQYQMSIEYTATATDPAI
jgi:hypothetical protein